MENPCKTDNPSPVPKTAKLLEWTREISIYNFGFINKDRPIPQKLALFPNLS